MSPIGCGCGGNNNAKVKYVFTDGNGRQVTYRSEIEAKAARIRAGGAGSIRTETK